MKFGMVLPKPITYMYCLFFFLYSYNPNPIRVLTFKTRHNSEILFIFKIW